MQRYKGVEPKKKFTSSFTIAMRVAHIDPCVVPSFNFFLIYVRVGGEVGNVDSNIDISNGSMFLWRNEPLILTEILTEKTQNFDRNWPF